MTGNEYQKLALRTLQRRLALLACARHKFVARLAQSVAVLAYHNEEALARARYDVHPVGKLEDIPLGHHSSGRQFDALAPDRKPRSA